MKMAESSFTNTELKAEPVLRQVRSQLKNSKTETVEDAGIGRNINRKSGSPNTSSAESSNGRAQRILRKFLFASYIYLCQCTLLAVELH